MRMESVKSFQPVVSSSPSLPVLHYTLLHSETWPPDFVWDYRDGRHCAMGLTRRIWPENQYRSMKEIFHMPKLDVERIFFKAGYRDIDFGLVTAEMVAYDIEAYLNPPPSLAQTFLSMVGSWL